MAERNKINKVFIVGTIEEVSTQVRATSDGRNFIGGKIVIKTVINDVENLIDCKVLAFEKTKTGDISKLFTSYKMLDGMLHKRVRVTAELAENYMPKQDGTLNKYNEVRLKFVSPAKSEDVDTATFEFNGFVVKSLYERKNKNDEVYGYRLEVAQANYNDSNVQVIRFDVNPQDVNIINAIEANYETGATIEINGLLSSISTTETKTEEVAFGDPIVKTFVKTDRQYRITGGKEVIGEESADYYSPEEIKKLIAAYKQSDVEKLAKEKAKEVGEEPAPAAASMASKIRTSSLI